MIYYTFVDSPIAQLLLTSDGKALTGLYMSVPERDSAKQSENGFGMLQGSDLPERNDHAFPFAIDRTQLIEYFEGEREQFDVPISLNGTAFQQRVWAELRNIPYGVAISYGELARRLANPNATRAAGLANGRNPISIIVPCHRVIGADRSLTGYGGGLSRKEALLKLEGIEFRPRPNKQVAVADSFALASN